MQDKVICSSGWEGSDDNDSGPQHDYAFSTTEGEHLEMVTIQVGGVDVKILIDSGANSNITEEGTREQLKGEGSEM